MGLFSIFKRKKVTEVDSHFEEHAEKVISEFDANDYLGKAAKAGHEAKDAAKAKKYDKAWGLYHDQKSFYMQHANRCGFTPIQTLALDATVHEEMANILRLEGKHHDALANILYWVLAGANRPIKRHKQKFQAYFNRCKFEKTTLAEAESEIANQSALPEYTLAQSITSNWIARG